MDALYYSPDRTKVIVFVLGRRQGWPSADGGVPEPVFYGSASIGTRERIGQLWQYFPFPTATLYSGFSDPAKILEALRVEYFARLKGLGEVILNAEGEKSPLWFDANLGEHRFWSSRLWEKGLRRPGRYLFEDRYAPMARPIPFVPIDFEPVGYPPDLVEAFARETTE